MKKHLFLKSLLIAIGLLVTSLTTQAWATPGFRKGNIYFDKSGWTDNCSSIQLVVGKDSYSSVYALNTTITNTQLVKGWCSNGDNWWDGTSYFAVVGNNSAWDGGYWGSSNVANASHYTGTNNSVDIDDSSNPFLCTKASASNGAALTISQKAGITGLNYTLTIKYAVSTNGATATELTSGYVPADITCSTYKFASGTYDAVSSSSLASAMTKNGSTYSSTASAAHTASTTLTVSNVDEDYTFLGWYTAASGGTELSTAMTYTTYSPTATATIYARFSHENNHSVTISRYCTSTSSEISSTSQKVGEITYSSITAPEIYGYTFSNWSYGNGISVKSGDSNTSNPIHVITKASGSYTLTANYTEDLTSTWYVSGASGIFGGWGSSGKNMQRKTGHSTEKRFYYTIDATKVINGSTSDSDLEFKIYNSSGDSYRGNSGYWVTRDNYQPALSSSSGDNMQFRPDAYGTYEFKVDCESPYSESAPKLTVTFGTKRKVTFGTRTGCKTVTAKYKNSVSMTSNQYVIDGSSVTFSQTANDGYTFDGWYNASSGGTKQSSSSSYTLTITGGDKTIYPNYTENTHTVTLAKSGSGHVEISSSTVTSVSGVGIATASGTITAVPDPGYYFTGWTGDIGSGVTLKTGTASSTSITINATADSKTITANFAPIWRIAGGNSSSADGSDAMGDWSTSANQITNITTSAGVMTSGYVEVSLPANTDFQFKVYNASTGYYWGKTSSVTKMEYSNRATAVTLSNNTGSNQTFRTAAAGTYRFTWTGSQITIGYPTSQKITIGQKTIYNEGESSDESETGGNVTAVDNSSNTITTGKYIANSANVTFTAHPADGYAFGGWYSDAACTTPITHNGTTIVVNDASKTLTLNTVTEDKTVYAKFSEIMTTVNLSIVGGEGGVLKIGDDPAPASVKVGVHTTKTVTAIADEGMYFKQWYEGIDADYSLSGTDEDHATTTITGGGAGGSELLQASFLSLERIYFKNYNEDADAKLWDVNKMYVYFHVTWQSGGAAGVEPDANYFAEMEPVTTGSNIFWAYVPRAVTRNNYAKIGFYDVWMSSSAHPNGVWNKFYNGNGVYRADYNKVLNMFVPERTKSSTDNGTNYYSNGYWKKYYSLAARGGGYYLKRWHSTNTYWQMGEFTADENGYNPLLKFSIRVDNTSADSCKYRIVSAGSENYVTASDITSSNYSNVQLNVNNTDNSYFSITATTEGEYVVTIDQTGEKMKISVDYPVALGDYRLQHSYTGKKKSNPAQDSTYYTYSDVIKKTTTTKVDTVSMYIGSTSGTLKLQKCTTITDGKPTWSSGVAVTNYTAATFNKGKGVYKYAIDVDNTNQADNAEVNSATASSVELYTGSFYIKTDAAPGGWPHYKENAMRTNTINFNREDASTFDYYYCNWYSVGRAEADANPALHATNVKCVIANDYNNAVSDTLIGDAVLGTYTEGGKKKPQEVLPCKGSVRFSYNSATNELKRSYMGVSTNSNYLNILPSAADAIFNMSSVDLNGQSDESRKLTDDGNYVYSMDIKAVPNGQASITATYNGSTQTLMPSQKMLGSSDEASDTKYDVHIVYDFQTNYFTSAWKPSGAISEPLKDVKVMFVRVGQNSANQITFLGSGALTNMGKVYGVFQFDYDDYYNKVGSWPQQYGQVSGYTNKMCMHYFSFPFDVKVNDIYGIGTYGREWKIQRYDGAERAKKGFFRGDGTTTFWKDLTLADTLKANVGYSLLLDNDYVNGSLGSLWSGKTSGDHIYLYFPSMNDIGSISNNERTINVPQHECKINRTFYDATVDKTLNHKNTDSDWNLMGVPLFSDQRGNFSTIFNQQGDSCNYLYAWNYVDNKLEVNDATDFSFRAMHAYMVQYHGNVTFTGSVIPSSVAARRMPIDGNYKIELQVLDNDENMINRAYVELKENACDTFALDEDLYMSPNGRIAEIYSFAGEYDVAANILSIANHTVELGMNIRTAGTYIISMPSNFSGSATLVDTYTGTRTNLAMSDYEISLPKGVCNDRFLLEIDITNAPTAIDGAENGEGSLKDGKAHKFIMNDMMFILRDGVIYDAQGKKVK